MSKQNHENNDKNFAKKVTGGLFDYYSIVPKEK